MSFIIPPVESAYEAYTVGLYFCNLLKTRFEILTRVAVEITFYQDVTAFSSIENNILG
jgi:hypothetical protein